MKKPRRKVKRAEGLRKRGSGPGTTARRAGLGGATM